MSRWLPDQLHILLAPDQVVVERRVMGLGLRGPEAKLRLRETLAVDNRGRQRPWLGALAALAGALEGLAERAHDATVVLSNHFVRYGLVPWSTLLAGADEETALARHYFRATYGEAVDQWELRVSVEPSAVRQLAGAVDRELLVALRLLFEDKPARLVSIQPCLMSVCNRHQAELAGDAWLLLAEPGQLCLGLIERGEFARLRSLRVAGAWTADLPALLEREAYLAEVDDPPHDVLLWARDGEAAPPPAGPWQFRRLDDPRHLPPPQAAQRPLAAAH